MLGGLSPRLLIDRRFAEIGDASRFLHQHAHQKDRVFDGFLLTVHWGLCPPPPDVSLVESFELTPEFKFKGSSQIRDDGGVPILVVNSESETMMVSMVRQPDSDTFRFWEMAGTAHGGGESAEAMTAVLVRDGISEGLPVVEGRNTIVWDYIARAGLEHLVEWIDANAPSVVIPPISLDESGIARDDVGNALGGVQLPDVVVPLAVHAGMKSKSSPAALMGESTPLSAERISGLLTPMHPHIRTGGTARSTISPHLGLVLPEAVAPVKARGRALYESAIGDSK